MDSIELIIICLNHNTAPLKVRERFVFDEAATACSEPEINCFYIYKNGDCIRHLLKVTASLAIQIVDRKAALVIRKLTPALSGVRRQKCLSCQTSKHWLFD